MNICNKILTCCCCYGCACSTGYCIDRWHAIEACGFSALECGSCCWSLCAPLCHSFSCGDTGSAMNHCANCVKYCLYACAVDCCAPCDGCINCILYIKDIFTEGVTGYGNVLKNTRFISSRIRGAFDFPESPQPVAKMSEYRP